MHSSCMEKKVDSHLRCGANEENSRKCQTIHVNHEVAEKHSSSNYVKDQRQMLLSNKRILQHLQLSLKIKEIKEKVRVAKMIEDLYIESLREGKEELELCHSFQDHVDHSDTSTDHIFSHSNPDCPSHVTNTTHGSSNPDVSLTGYIRSELSQLARYRSDNSTANLKESKINNEYLKTRIDSREAVNNENERRVISLHDGTDDQDSLLSSANYCDDDSENTELMVDFYTDEVDLLVDFPSVRSIPHDSAQSLKPSGNLLVPFKNLQG